MNFANFINLLLPEIILLVTALAALTAGLMPATEAGLPAKRARQPSTLPAMITLLGITAAAAGLTFFTADGSLAGDGLVIDPLTRLFKLILLALAFVATLLLAATPPTHRPGENFALFLFAVIGMLIVIGTEELLVLFIGLELTAISLYALVGFAKKDGRSAEAALKYFLFGSLAAAFLLFGMSLIYGFAGTTDLTGIGAALQSSTAEPILAVGIAMILLGFGFKVAAVPFHLWAPDVYQGAPTPTAALIASGSKLAGIFILTKVLLLGFTGVEGNAGWGEFQPGWIPVLSVLAALSMVIGNIVALAQTSVRRILAYSGIGHAGFMLTALCANTPEAAGAVLFYVTIYGIATLGTFAVVAAVMRNRGNDRISDFSGLARHSPITGLCLVIFLASLAGLPPLAGFLGKFYLFTTALGNTSETTPGMLWLVAIALLMSAVSLYYYLRIVKQAYLYPADSTPPCGDEKSLISPITSLTCIGLAAMIIILGLLPNLLIGPIESAVRMWILGG